MNGITLTPTRGHLLGGLPMLTALAAGEPVPEGVSDWENYLDSDQISETWRNCPLVGYIDFSYVYHTDNGTNIYEIEGQSTRAGFIQLDDSELGFTEVGEAEFDLSIEHEGWWPILPATLVNYSGVIDVDPFSGSYWLYQVPTYYTGNVGEYEADRVPMGAVLATGTADPSDTLGTMKVLHDSTVTTELPPVGDEVTVSTVTINRVDWITTF